MYFLFELIYKFICKTRQKPNFASVFKFIIPSISPDPPNNVHQ